MGLIRAYPQPIWAVLGLKVAHLYPICGILGLIGAYLSLFGSFGSSLLEAIWVNLGLFIGAYFQPGERGEGYLKGLCWSLFALGHSECEFGPIESRGAGTEW